MKDNMKQNKGPPKAGAGEAVDLDLKGLEGHYA